MLVNRIFVIDTSTRSTGRQVDKSTGRQVDKSIKPKYINGYVGIVQAEIQGLSA